MDTGQKPQRKTIKFIVGYTPSRYRWWAKLVAPRKEDVIKVYSKSFDELEMKALEAAVEYLDHENGSQTTAPIMISMDYHIRLTGEQISMWRTKPTKAGASQ